jgi:hypothetical protein
MSWDKVKEHLINMGEQIPDISEASIKMAEDVQKLHLNEVQELSKVLVTTLKELKGELGSGFTEALAIAVTDGILGSGCDCPSDDGDEDSRFS